MCCWHVQQRLSGGLMWHDKKKSAMVNIQKTQRFSYSTVKKGVEHG